MESILQELQPEAAYFTDVEGTRGGYLVVNMEDASQIPAVTEPLLLGLGASVHMQPVMTPEDLRGAAGEALQQMGQKYG
jgi:predicted component of type VI protein secretion system